MTAWRLSGRNPLTGLNLLQRLTAIEVFLRRAIVSQSPYGAKPSATRSAAQLSLFYFVLSQSPYGAKPSATEEETEGEWDAYRRVAIPLRG